MDEFTVGEMNALNTEPMATLEVEDHSEVCGPPIGVITEALLSVP